jgi:dipeptidyl aminopeptidase/acylaminoacyl peptidase
MRVAAFVVAATLASVAPAVAATVTPDDVFHVVSIAEPAFSPDGSKIVAVERRADASADKRPSDLILTDVASKTVRVLTHDRTGVSSALPRSRNSASSTNRASPSADGATAAT